MLAEPAIRGTVRGLPLLLAVLVVALLVASPPASAQAPPRLATQDPEDQLQVRPAVVSYTGDGTGYLGGRTTSPGHLDRGGLNWISWKHGLAVAHGFAWLNDCRPDCARGHFSPHRAMVRARRPRHGRFTRMTIKFRYAGRYRYDHRSLAHSPPSEYDGEYFPGYWYWNICGSPYTSRC